MEGQRTSEHKDFEYITSSGGIDEYKLKSNNMSVLLMEDFSAPVVAVMVTYMVGSRNEAIGYTGSTHLLEHLMFKGSKEFNKEKGTSIWTVLQNVGASINATTWLDRTNYYELIPKEHLEVALKIESDRMRNAFIRDDDRKPEMTVVRNEYERGENEPQHALDKHIWSTAYFAHPYHHSTIGWRSDIENVPIERLREFYDTFYVPNNAVLTIIGDFDRSSTLHQIAQNFGHLSPSTKPLPPMYTTEPELTVTDQEGIRRVEVRRVGQISVIGIAHKSPPGLSSDYYSLNILQTILSRGKTSRFFKKIVDKGLGTEVRISNHPFKDPGLFVTYVTLTPGTEIQEIEKLVFEEYENIKKNGVTEEEVSRAKALLKTDALFTRDGAFSVAASVNEAIARGDWKAYTTLLPNINSVTCSRVQLAAQKYFQDEKCTVGYFIPKKEKEQDVKEQETVELVQTAPSPQQAQVQEQQLFAQRVKEHFIHGIRVLCLKTAISEVVTINGSLLGGNFYHSNSMVPELLGRLLDQGTKKRSKFQIAELLASCGAVISFEVENFRVKFFARFLRENTDLILDLISEQLREPLLSPEDFATVKKRLIGDLEKKKQRTASIAVANFRKILYPKEHANCSLLPDEEIQLANEVTLEQIQSFYASAYGSGNMIISCVGDIDEPLLINKLDSYFSSWTNSSLSLVPSSSSAFPNVPKNHETEIKDKTSVDVFIGQSIGIDRNHNDFLPLYVGVFILGGNFSARLMSTVRDQEGLTYHINSSVGGVDNLCDGHWAINGSFAPKLLDRGIKSTLEQIKKWRETGISKEELESKKSTIIGQFKVNMSTSRGLASSILINAERGRSVSYLDEYPALIEKISVEQVNEVINKYVDAEKLVVASAGSYEQQVAKL